MQFGASPVSEGGWTKAGPGPTGAGGKLEKKERHKVDWGGFFLVISCAVRRTKTNGSESMGFDTTRYVQYSRLLDAALCVRFYFSILFFNCSPLRSQ